MQNRFLIIIVFSVSLMVSLKAQHIKNSVCISPLLPNQEIPLNSVIYCLPKTIVKIDVVVEKTICKPGVFMEYSENLLNIPPAVTEETEHWEIKQISISTYGEADKAKRYAITASGDASAQFVSLTPDGRLLGVNVLDNINENYDQTNIPETKLDFTDVSFTDVPFLEKQLKTTSLPAMATSTSELIYKLRKRQLKLLGFEYEHHPCDMPSLKFSTEELKLQEVQFTELFVGKCLTQRFIRSFSVESSAAQNSAISLFAFSKKMGFVNDGTVESDTYSYKCTEINNGNVEITQKKELKRCQAGLVYNIPTTIDFSVIKNESVVSAKQIQIAVSGVIADISPKILIQKGVSVRFDVKTGALISIQKLSEK